MTETNQTRRALIGSTLAFPLAASPAFTSRSAVIDPHPQWLIDWRKARVSWIDATEGAGDETPESEAHFLRSEEIAEMIMNTPAKTPKGVEAQLRWVKEDCDDEFDYPGYRTAIDSALAALAVMA